MISWCDFSTGSISIINLTDESGLNLTLKTGIEAQNIVLAAVRASGIPNNCWPTDNSHNTAWNQIQLSRLHTIIFISSNQLIAAKTWLFFNWWFHSAASQLRNKIKDIDSLAAFKVERYLRIA